MHSVARILNALMVLVFMGILASAYYQQFFKHEMPCPLCILQRLGMFSVSLGALMNLRFGIKPKFYGLSLLSALYGAGVALRQMALHVCPNFPVFGLPVFGIDLYTWSFFAFATSIFALSILLFLYNPKDVPKEKPKLHWLDKLAFLVFIILLSANFITTFMECGLGACKDVPWPQNVSSISLFIEKF